MKLLNLGCNIFKIKGFINIDIDPDMSPDLCMDLANIKEHFSDNSVNFILANHVFEHLTVSEGIKLLKDCYSILKSGGSIVITVPDYTKTPKNDCELESKIILGDVSSQYGRHKSLYSILQLQDIFQKAGFNLYTELELNKVPFLIVSDINNPIPDPWQTSFVGVKI